MQLMIDIDEETFNKLPNAELGSNVVMDVLDAVEEGTPLPKGHGRLGDLDALEKEMIGGINAGLMIDGYEDYSNINDMDDCLELVKYADTIIKADKEGEDKI